jgi:hypothetical protein
MNNRDLCLEEITKCLLQKNLMEDKLEYFTDLEYFNYLFFHDYNFIVDFAFDNYLLTPQRINIMFQSYQKNFIKEENIDYDYINDNLFFDDNSIINDLFDQLQDKKDMYTLYLFCYSITKQSTFYKIYKETINIPVNLNI